jgi:thioredoxin reductase
MSTLVTAVVFLAVTAVVIVWHLRRTGPCETTKCPKCGSAVPAGALHCPACDVPMQVFEIAAAAEAAEAAAEEGGGDDGERLHAIVRADVCVGCAACVPVCPEAGAIRMEGKLAVVDRHKCTAQGKCVEACPVGGIVMGTGGMSHRVVVPDVRSDFQTNVPGLYIAGELGGRGLIKNAVNEGRVAAENVAREIRAEREAGRRPPPGEADVVIVGSGPAGLSAALTARREGLRFEVLEQGSLSDSIRKYPRHKLLLAEPVGIPLYGELWVSDASKETLLAIWESTIAQHEIAVRSGARVEEIVRAGGSFHLRGNGFEARARRVILALGRRGTPRRLGVPGEDSGKVFYDIVEMEEFAGRRVLVVGGGDSALESAVGLANQPNTDVTLSYRRDTFDRAKERNVRKIEAVERAGALRVLRRSQVLRIEADRVVLEHEGREVALPNDDVIVRIGGEPPTAFLEKTGVRSVTKEVPLAEAKAGVG